MCEFLWLMFQHSRFSSVAQLCPTLSDPTDCSTTSFPVLHQLPELARTRVYRFNDAIQPSHPLLFPSRPAFNLSQHQGLLQWVNSSHQVAKVLEFQLQHQSFQLISGLISFRMDWLDFLAVQGIHVSSPTILSCSDFFIVQFSHPYMTTGKTIAFTRQTFLGKVMSLHFNMLSRFVMEKGMSTYSSILA